jgi:ribonuclease G
VAAPVREMLISHDPDETRVAIIEDDELVEFYVERARRSVVGNVYLGRVKDVLPGMEAAFVDIGLEKNAFLYVDEVVTPAGIDADMPKQKIQQLLKPGQQVTVQVTKDPMGTKGARVTTEVSLPGRFLVLMPFSESVGVSRRLPDAERERLHKAIAALAPEGVGIIARTAASGANERDLTTDLDFLGRLWARVRKQADTGAAPEVLYTEMDLALRMVRDVFTPDYRALVIDDKAVQGKVVSFLKRTQPDLVRRVQMHREAVPLFDYHGLGPQIEAALRRKVTLPSGGSISIDRTEALTAIDVNTGKFVGRKSLEDTILRTNLEAADEVVRQLRLRDIGGIIIIDFIDMAEPIHRDQVFAQFNAALERDRTKTRVSEISRLGLVEMTRKNVTDGFWTVLTQTCPTCTGQGRTLSDPTVRIMVTRRLREILRVGRSSAYLFSVAPATYAVLTDPSLNLVAQLQSESGKLVTLIADQDLGPTEVKVIMEGHRS